MNDHTEPDRPVIERRGTVPGQRRPGLPPVHLLTESSPWQDPTVSKIRFVSVGPTAQTQAVTLADLLEFEPAAGSSAALYELRRCP